MLKLHSSPGGDQNSTGFLAPSVENFSAFHSLISEMEIDIKTKLKMILFPLVTNTDGLIYEPEIKFFFFAYGDPTYHLKAKSEQPHSLSPKQDFILRVQK